MLKNCFRSFAYDWRNNDLPMMKPNGYKEVWHKRKSCLAFVNEVQENIDDADETVLQTLKKTNTKLE
jgi:hypothetical protein